MYDLITKYFIAFIIFSCIGWIWEVIVTLFEDKKFVDRGFLNGPYCPIYGFGGYFLLYLQHYTTRPVELFFLGATICCVLEYAVSFGMEKIFQARWWNYKKYPLNLNGRICFYGFVAFGTFSVLMLWIAPWVFGLIENIPNDIRTYGTPVLMALFLADTTSSNASMACFNSILRDYQKQIQNHGFVKLITKNHIVMFLTKENKLVKVLTAEQKRIISAFPDFESIKYPEAFNKIISANQELKKKFKNSKYTPEKVETGKK